jgi:fatty-acyl-CoA synthase
VIVVSQQRPVPDGTIDYESLVASHEPMQWPALEERRAAAMCYTSGTTGRPKGVVYSHRALVLHSLMAALPDSNGASAHDTILPVVPMFHANAWGLPYTGTFVGAALVLPGPKLDPVSVLDLMADERVTLTAGVPTVWMAVLQALDAEPDRWDLSALHRLLVGGSAVPRSLLEGFDRHGLTIIQAWGMTETSPLGSVCRLTPDLVDAPAEQQYDFRSRQGVPVPFVDVRARGDDGELVEWDDAAMGELEVRGPWVAAAYHRGVGAEKFTDDGWFATGDVVKIDSRGCIRICDRSKDLVKSGGEWISSVDLENLLMAHPAVVEAAVIAIPDERWGERPMAVVVVKDGEEATPDELREHLATEFAKWQLPERFEFIDALPRTATGKFKKTDLRERYVKTAV